MAFISANGDIAIRKPNTNKPKTPSLADIQRRAIASYQSQIQDIINRAKSQMVPVPTYSPSYFMPTDILKKIDAIRKQKPKLNTAQLQNIAQTSVNLLTNPQIEALRQQINQLKSMQPQAENAINKNYGTAQQQLGQSVQDLIAQTYNAAQQKGGLHSGAAAEIMAQATSSADPYAQLLEQNRQLDIKTVLSGLQTQIQNAQNTLHDIEKNKKNLTKVQYNALKDQATEQWRTAQQAQLKILQSLAEMSTNARETAAQLNQQKALDTNALINNMLQQQLESVQSQQQDYLKNFLPQVQQQNLSQWLDYLTSASDINAAMKRLDENKDAIIASVGSDGYQTLLKQLKKFPANWTNPNYELPYTIINSGNTSSSASSSSHRGITQSGSIFSPNPVGNYGPATQNILSILTNLRNLLGW